MRPLALRLTRALAAACLTLSVWMTSTPPDRAHAASGDASIDEIDRVRRGKKGVQLRADVDDPGLTCHLKIKYPDGNADSPDAIVSNGKGICEFSFDVPSRRSVVGEAVAKLTVLDTKGQEVAKTSRWFTVRDRRG